MRHPLFSMLVAAAVGACTESLRDAPTPVASVAPPVAASAVSPASASTMDALDERVPSAPRSRLRNAVLHPSGKFLATTWEARFCTDYDASACEPGLDRFAVWRFPELEVVGRFGLRTKGPNAVGLSFSSDGSRMYVVPGMSSSYDAHGLELWAVDSWQPIATPQAGLSSGVGGGESPDARHLLLADVYTQVELYDLSTGARRLSYTFPMSNAPNRGASVAFSSDSRYAVLVDPLGPVEIWDLPAAKRRPLTTMKGVGGAAVFLPDTHDFILSDGDGSVRVWDVQGKTKRRLSGPVGTPPAYADGPIDELRLTGDNRLIVVRTGCDVRRFSLGGGAPEVLANAQAKPYQDADCQPSISNDGTFVAMVRRLNDGYSIELLEVATKSVRRLVTVGDSSFPYVGFVGNGHVSVTGESGTTYFDVITGKPSARPVIATPPLGLDLSIDDDGKLALTRPSDGTRISIALDIDTRPSAEDRSALAKLLSP